MALHIIKGSAAPTAAPTVVGQHFIDEVNKKVYLSVGTTNVQDWQEVGSGAGFGLVPSKIVQLDGTTSTETWDMVTQGPLEVRADGVAAVTISLDLSAFPGGSETLQSKMTLMAGSDGGGGNITVNLTLSGALSDGTNEFYYVDSHNADYFSGSPGNKALSLSNQLLFFDVIVTSQPADGGGLASREITLVKTGQIAATVAHGGGG